MRLLKQSTAVVIEFGPFVDKADGVTLKTGLVSAIDHASTGIMLSKNGGTLVVRHASVTASTYDAHGNYKVTLDTTDTGSLGTLRAIYTDATTCLPVWADFMIVPANIYDSLISGSDLVQVDVTQLLNTAWLAPSVAGTPDVNAKLHGGTAQTGRDIGASVLLSPGTGTGQLDFTSGVVKANLVQILATALTETAGQIAGGFKKFFNIGSPASTMDALTLVATATNLTNAPTSGDLTATMKASITTAASAATPAVTVSDKTGFSLSTAGILAIWHQLVNAVVTGGTMGKLIVDYLDAAISSRLASGSYTAPPTAAQNRAEMDSNSTKLANLDAAVSTRLAGAGYTAPDNSSITAIKAKTDLIPAAPAAVGDIPTAAHNADKLLGRSLAGGADGGRTVQDALRPLRNKVDAVSEPGVLIVMAENDSTEAWRAAITTDGDAEPIVTVDPT